MSEENNGNHLIDSPELQTLYTEVEKMLTNCRKLLRKNIDGARTRTKNFDFDKPTAEHVADILDSMFHNKIINYDIYIEICGETEYALMFYSTAEVVFHFLESLLFRGYLDGNLSLLKETEIILTTYSGMVSGSIREAQMHAARFKQYREKAFPETIRITEHSQFSTLAILDTDPVEEFRIIKDCFDILVSNKSMTPDQMSSYLDNFSSHRDTIYIKLYQAFINGELEEDIEMFVGISDLLIQYFTRKKDVRLAEKVRERIQSYLS